MGKKTNFKTSLVMSLFLLAIVSTAWAEIMYVDADASPGVTGRRGGRLISICRMRCISRRQAVRTVWAVKTK